MSQASKGSQENTSSAGGASLGSKVTVTPGNQSSTADSRMGLGPAETRYPRGPGRDGTLAHVSGAYDSDAEEVQSGLLFGTKPRFYTAAQTERGPGGQSRASGTGSSQ
jgi:hypothetical protein